MRLLVLLALLFYGNNFAIEGRIRSRDDTYGFIHPRILSVTTTREIASKFSTSWDIQRRGSHRILDSTEDVVRLKVAVWEKEELADLKRLAAAGVVTLTEDDMDNEDNRRLRDSEEQQWSDFPCYRSVEEIMTSMDALAEQYPGFVNVTTIGESWKKKNQQGGHDIKVMVLSAPSSFTIKETMMVIGGQHSRELAPPETILRWAEHLLSSYTEDAEIAMILNRTNIHLVTLANPDGREIVEEHMDWLYRKNAHPSGCDRENKDGVDLNRNYPMWFEKGDNPCSLSYSGKSALSEPESNAIYNYIHNLFPQESKRGPNAMVAESRSKGACPEKAPGILLEVHVPGEFVYFPWGYEDIVSPNHLSLLTMAAKLAHAGNYTLWGPGQDDFKYFVNGDATDAAYGIDCVASFGFELGTQFYEKCEELESKIVPMMFKNFLYAAKTARAPYQLPLGPDVLKIMVTSTQPDILVVKAKVSDDALIVRHAKFPDGERKRHPIDSVHLYVDVHPDDDLSHNDIKLHMLPINGRFDRSFEMATYSLNVSSWEQGSRHVLYVQAIDQGNHTGPVSAMYVTKS